MSGVKREWMGGTFVSIHLGLLEELGGDYETAAVIWAVHYHAGIGWWRATREEFQRATGLTKHKLDTALKRARGEGYVESSNLSRGSDRTLSWRISWEEGERPGIGDMTSPDPGHDIPESGISSSSKKNSAVENSAPARKRAHQLPADFEPDETCRLIARDRDVDIDAELEQMRDWAAGKGEVKKDWQATFRNWLRRSRPGSGYRGERPAEEEPVSVEELEARLSDEEKRAADEWAWTHPVRLTPELEELMDKDPQAYHREMQRLGEENYRRAVERVRRGA